MKQLLLRLFTSVVLLFLANIKLGYAEIVKKIQIVGNDRISEDTVKIFSEVSLNDNLDSTEINNILKKLYSTNYFKDVKVSFRDNLLLIKVIENPIIENINYTGIKANKIIEAIKENSLIKPRFSYNEIILKNEKNRIIEILKKLGYYKPKVEIYVSKKQNNLVNIDLDFELGNKAKIKKISFVGNKVFKSSRLKRVIASSEYKFWKFLSGRKFLNEELVNFDKQLLSNYYKNNGYYSVEINSSFAKMVNDGEFELIFNIDAKSKVFFGNVALILPSDFDEKNFIKINKLFKKIKGDPYSINTVDEILEEIDTITAQEQYQFIKANVKENLIDNKLDLTFNILETEKFYVKKINIFGNNITSENVIRNQLEVDEGDPFNEILFNKSINNIKSLNFFKSVKREVFTDANSKTKTLNISVEEKPTGEISATAGVGTDGGTFGFGIKENNFLGNGIRLDSNISISSDTLKGKLSVTNPNLNNTDKSFYTSVEAQETNNLSTTGYKTNKTGIGLGTNFEYLDDLYLGIGNSNFYEKIETNSTASARQKAQAGNYWDSILKLDLDLDKRNQKFQTSSGFRSFYSLDLPVISDTYTLKNYYNHSYYFDLFEKNISSISVYLEAANSLQNKDIKLSERIKIPSRRLRGFETGRIGPKDGKDYIGGNYAYSLNFSSTIPQIFEESQNVDFLFFTDVADIWGVDYNSALNKNEIRSSVGLALDWYSPVGPLNFSLAQPITKADTDKTQSFRFNLGTTF